MEVRGGGAKRDRSGKTCEQCRVAHAACDKERPCRRCRRLGDHCSDQQHRKRGRAAANRNGHPSVTDHHDNHCLPHCGHSDQPQQPSQPHLQLEDLLGFDFSATASHDHHPLHDEATTTTTATATAQHHAQHAGQVGDRAVHYSYDHRQQQQELQEQRITSLENRLEVLTRLVHTMGNDLRELHQANARLRAKLKRREVGAKSSSSDRRSAPQPSGTASAAAFTATLWPATSSSSPSSSSSSPPLSSSSSSTSPSTSSPSSSSSHPFIVERRPSFAFELSVLHSGVSPVLAMEARRQLPWLLHYDIPTRFSIVDFSHPICVMETMSSLDVPACVSYANAAFLALSGYAWGELIGSPHTQIFSFRRSYLDLSAILYNQRPMTASDVFSFSQLLRRKNGRTVRLDDQSQVFYDRNGNGQYNVICVLGWKEDGLMPGEAFDTWLPLRPPATVAVQTSALPASRVNPASTRTTTSSMTPAMSAPPAPVGTAERSRPGRC